MPACPEQLPRIPLSLPLYRIAMHNSPISHPFTLPLHLDFPLTGSGPSEEKYLGSGLYSIPLGNGTSSYIKGS